MMKKMLLALAVVASFSFMSSSAHAYGWRVVRRPVIAPVRRVIAAPFVRRRVIYRRPIVAPVVYPVVPTTGVYIGVGY